MSLSNDSLLQRHALAYIRTQAPVLFLRLNHDGQVLETNGHVRAISGRDLVGANLRDLFVEFAEQRGLQSLTAEPDRLWLVNVNQVDGLPQTYYMRFVDIGDEILAVGHFDAGELEIMRREIIELNRELSESGRELEKKNATLDRLNILKNQFLGMAAHDLRKPVGIILMYAESLQDELRPSLTPEQTTLLGTIVESTEYMRRLIDDFLDISMIESGRLELDLESTDVSHIMDRLERTLEPVARHRNVQINSWFASDLQPALLDAGKIEQVLINIVSNAIEYSKPGYSVEVKCEKSGDDIVVTVDDEGPGIASEDIGIIFRPFERGKEKVRRTRKGAGLGLAIAKKIIDAHGGDIQVSSVVGEGTRFRIVLPISGRKRSRSPA